ncbi:MAG: hypothetical protein M1831_004655 [Alyxoria varia]|nr:MAG: hypothetical protein M1831_004655 [Alyxoria varia]
MGQNGPYKGEGCDAYQNAWAFFKKRERKGIPLPNKRRKPNSTSNKKDDNGTASRSEKTGTKKAKSPFPDLSGIHLDGEETDSVPIYDSCNELRRKISSFMRRDGVTQAAFMRALSEQYHLKNMGLQSSKLTRFRNQKGVGSGNTSDIFYAAYVFFEKIRIRDGKPKSNHRLGMEDEWGDRGMDTDDPIQTR